MYSAATGGRRVMGFGVLRSVPVHWLLLSLVLMFASAYCAMLWVGALGAISGWIGLPAYADALEKVRSQGQWWKALTLLLPFIAALLLMLRRPDWSKSSEPGIQTHRAIALTREYAVRLVAAIMGSLLFLVILFLISLLMYRLGIHSGGTNPASWNAMLHISI